MLYHYSKENLLRLATECGWSPNQATLIKKQETYINTKTLAALAQNFNVEPWMLLLPDFDPKNPPKRVLTSTEFAAFSKLENLVSQVSEKDN